MDTDEARDERGVASEDGLIYKYYSPAPARLRLSPESRTEIRETLRRRLSRNEALRQESALSAAGIKPTS